MYNLYQHKLKLHNGSNGSTESVKPTPRLTPLQRSTVVNHNNSVSAPHTPKTTVLHEHMSKYQKPGTAASSARICAEVINTARNTNSVLSRMDYDNEEKTLLVLLQELEQNKNTKKKKRSIVPSKPISYTKKYSTKLEKYETKVEPTPTIRDQLTSTVNNGTTDRAVDEMNNMLPAHPRYEDYQKHHHMNTVQAVSAVSATAQPLIQEQTRHLSPSRPVSAPASRASNARVSHAYLSSVMPVATQQNLISTRKKSVPMINPIPIHDKQNLLEKSYTPSRTENNATPDHGEQMGMLIGDLVHEYHLTTSQNSKYQKVRKRYQKYLQSQYHKDAPIQKQPFRRHFGSRDFGWTDSKVRDLNKKIDSAFVEQSVLERFEQENIELIEKKIKVNQIRKVFKDQRQQNFLKRVVGNEPRVIQQLQDLVQNDTYYEYDDEQQEEYNSDNNHATFDDSPDQMMEVTNFEDVVDNRMDQWIPTSREQQHSRQRPLSSAATPSESPNFMKFKNLIPSTARESLKNYYHAHNTHSIPTTTPYLSSSHSSTRRPVSATGTHPSLPNKQQQKRFAQEEVDNSDTAADELAEIERFEHRLKAYQKLSV
jgi:hypothetical protein